MDPDDVQRRWADRSDVYSPEYYAEIGPNEVSDTLVAVFEQFLSDDAAILEVGCSSGRHLERLRRAGYENLTGIDINDEAIAVMADYYPQLAETATVRTGAIEDLVPEIEDGAFDAVYSVETLQHVHPDNVEVFAELVRVTDDLLITAENEGNSPRRGRGDADVSTVDDDVPLYHRDWKRVFSDLGLAQLIREPGPRDTVRAFRVLD